MVRGFGQSPTNFAIESGIDKIARTLGMDRFELQKESIRLMNFPIKFPAALNMIAVTIMQFCKRPRIWLDWTNYLKSVMPCAKEAGGVGVSTCLEPSGGNARF